MLGYDNKLSQVGVYCSTCGHPPVDDCNDASCEGGIWQAGGGPAVDSWGNVYVMTGNGSFDQAAGDLSTSFIKLDADLHVLGSWTPPNYRCLSETDSDLGSAGPLILPWKQDGGVDTEVLVGGGKEGLLYAIRTDFMQGARMGDGTPLGPREDPYEPCAYRVDAPGGAASEPSYWAIQAAPRWEGGDHPTSDSDCNTSDSTPEGELGLFAKFAPPTVSEGKVYMATVSNELVVYGVKSTPPLPRKALGVAKEQGYDAQLSLC